MPTKTRRAVVVVVDGWGAGFLGPYGNTWLETPTCNRLAADGLLLEHALVDSPTLASFYHAVWQGTHAVWSPASAAAPLAELLADRGGSSCLITDEQEVLKHPVAESFTRAEWVSPRDSDTAADVIDQTQMARLFATAATTLDDDPPGLCWIHSSGMRGNWDAPRELREQFRDEDDPPVMATVSPPTGAVPTDADPDLIQGWVWAYAGQVALLDELLDGLLAAWRRIQDPCLLVVMGARGFALAEHRIWGIEPAALYSEHLHVPLLVVSSTGELADVRSQQLVQPFHVHATLLNWFELDRAPSFTGTTGAANLRSLAEHELTPTGSGCLPLAAARLDQLWAMRTPAWHACTVRDAESADLRVRLYLKPDDRWDVNDVANRCPQIVERFVGLHTELERRREYASPSDVSLDPELLEPPV